MATGSIDSQNSSNKQFGLSRLFRMHVSVAGIASTGVYLHTISLRWPTKPIPIAGFLIAVLACSILAYAIARLAVGRHLSALTAITVAGMAGAEFTRVKMDHPRDLLILGMCVGISWLLGFGWLDRKKPASRAMEEA